MSEKKHRRNSVKEFSNLQIADTNFVSEFLEFCKEANVSPLPKFRVKSSDNKLSMLSILSTRTAPSSSEQGNQFTKIEEKDVIPIFHVTYENTKKLENPQKLECKGFEITICTLDALNLTMKNYNTITTLELPNCQINAYGIVQISEMLTEIGCVTDLNLDRNPNIKENYYLLCTPRNNLLYLSLRSCKISDEGIKKIVKELEHRDPPDNPKLIALSLSNNNISQNGAKHIALMLRTNRSLRSLILTGNRICDAGATSIIQELVMYTYHHSKMILKEVEWCYLTHDEIIEFRRRKYARIMLRKEKLKVLEQISKKVESSGSKESSIDERSLSLAAIRKVSRFQRLKKKSISSKQDNPKAKETDDPNTLRLTTLQDLAESMLEPEYHPLTLESIPIKGDMISTGNFKLQHLNLSFNRLTNVTLKKLVSCLQYQEYMILGDSANGLIYISLEGNNVTMGNNEDWIRLKELLHIRRHPIRTSHSEDYKELVPAESKILRSKVKLKD